MSISPESTEQTPNGVLVGRSDQDVFIRVDGRGTHLVSEPLRLFLSDMMQRGFKSFHLDLNHCPYLDSTFIGILTGACLRLRAIEGGAFFIHGLGKRNLELLQTLGVAEFFEIDPSTPLRRGLSEGLHPLEQEGAPESTLRTVLEAHRTLAQLDEQNAKRFKDVLECLENEPASSPSDDKGRSTQNH